MTGTYEPIPDFSGWPHPFDDGSFQAKVTLLQEILRGSEEVVAKSVANKLAREAAAETGAIEGLYSLEAGQTRIIAEEDPGWQTVLTEQRSDALDLFISQTDAYEYVCRESNAEFEMSEHWLKELHARICTGQSHYAVNILLPDGAFAQQDRRFTPGRYKDGENELVRRGGDILKFCPPVDVSAEMHRLVDQVNAPAFSVSHPVTQAAYVHYCLTRIHPFPDGNGRTARAWASLYTYRAFDLPIIVYSDRRMMYLQALEFANQGRFADLVQHFLYRVNNTVLRSIEELESLTAPSVFDLVDDLLAIKPADSRVQLAGARDLAKVILTAVEREFKSRIVGINERSDGELVVECGAHPSARGTSYFDYGSMPSGDPYDAAGRKTVTAALKDPAGVKGSLDLNIGIAQDLEADYTFHLVATKYVPSRGSARLIEVADLRLAYEDAFPDVATSASARISLFAEKVLGDLMDDLRRMKLGVLRRGGIGAE